MRLLILCALSISAFAADQPKAALPTVPELQAEIRLLKAQLAKQQVQCQIALLPQVQGVDKELTAAQEALDALKKPQAAKVETPKP